MSEREAAGMLELIKQLEVYGVQMDIQPRPDTVSFVFGKGEFSKALVHIDLKLLKEGKLGANSIEVILLVALDEFMTQYESSRK